MLDFFYEFASTYSYIAAMRHRAARLEPALDFVNESRHRSCYLAITGSPEMRLMMKTLPVTLAVSLVLALTSAADAKQTKRHKHHAKPAPAATWRSNEANVRQQPARMIEVKPGYWMSSYGCVMDGGYGRVGPCDLTDHSD